MNKNTFTIHPGTNRHQFFRAVFASLAFAILYFASANITAAAVSTCSNVGNLPFPNGQNSYDIQMDRVTYKGPFVSNSADSRASWQDGEYRVQLRGWLYYKKSASGDVENARVLIYNHGHEAGRPEPCQIVKNFVNQGYVVFAPLRRGHFAKAPDPDKDSWFEIRSTGIHIDTYINKCLRSFPVTGDRPNLYRGSSVCRANSLFPGDHDENAIETDYLRRQRTDIRDQVEYIQGLPAIGTSGKLADPTRIALLGHSFGGSAVIFANEFDYGQNVTIAVSAAEKSWGPHNPYWQFELAGSMENQARPIYMLQPKNGRSLGPTKVLFAIAVEKKYTSQAAIFPAAPCSDPPLPNGSCDESEREDWEQYHSTFVGDKDQVALWAPSVRNFIFRHPRPQPSM